MENRRSSAAGHPDEQSRFDRGERLAGSLAIRNGTPTEPQNFSVFQNIFLRRRFPVYLIDQPRRGRAARGTQPIAITATPDEQLWFGIFRLGAWPDFYPGSSLATRRRLTGSSGRWSPTLARTMCR